MGASVSTNVANTVTNVSLGVVNTYSQDCSSNATQSQIIDINGCNCVVVSGLTQGQNTYINTRCLQSASTQTKIDSSISQTMQQAASAIVQNFGLPAISVATDITNAVTQLGYSIANSYTQSCVTSFKQDQVVHCTNSNNVTITNLDQQQTNQQITNCVAQDTTVSALTSQLTQLVSQTAVAKEENAFTAFAIVGAVVVLIVLILLLGN
jgi:hypothetical protein